MRCDSWRHLSSLVIIIYCTYSWMQFYYISCLFKSRLPLLTSVFFLVLRCHDQKGPISFFIYKVCLLSNVQILDLQIDEERKGKVISFSVAWRQKQLDRRGDWWRRGRNYFLNFGKRKLWQSLFELIIAVQDHDNSGGLRKGSEKEQWMTISGLKRFS